MTFTLTPAELQAYQANLNRRRAEFAFNNHGPKAPAVISRVMAKVTLPVTLAQPSPQTASPVKLAAEDIRFWPVILTAAITHNHGGAARLWYLARNCDCTGSGWIYRADLDQYLNNLGVDDRQQRRYRAEAQALGLLVADNKRGQPIYRIASLFRGAVILEAKEIGLPAEMQTKALFSKGWRCRVWAAFEATTRSRPISQETKAEITTIDPRTQRNYLAALPIEKRHNYAKTRLTGDHVTGLREHGRRSAFIGDDKRIYYRLPDQVTVPLFIARTTHKGRSRKAQRLLNISFSSEREKANAYRLFHADQKGVTRALKKLGRDDIPPWEQPQEMYVLQFPGLRSNLWQPVAVNAGVLL